MEKIQMKVTASVLTNLENYHTIVPVKINDEDLMVCHFVLIDSNGSVDMNKVEIARGLAREFASKLHGLEIAKTVADLHKIAYQH